MKNIIYQLNNTEKHIIENQFIYNGLGSKNNFELFATQLINNYSNTNFSFKDQPREKDYSIDLMWNEETQETAFMNVFSNKKFKPSNSKMKSFLIFNGDINRVDVNDENAFMKLSRNINQINTISMYLNNNDDGFNFKQINKKNESVHSICLEALLEDLSNVGENFLGKEMGVLGFINKVGVVELIAKNWVLELKGVNQFVDTKVYDFSEKAISIMRDAMNDREKEFKKSWNFDMLFESLDYTEKFLLSNKLQDDLKVSGNSNRRPKI